MKNNHLLAPLLALSLVATSGVTVVGQTTNWDGVGGGTTTVGPNTYGNWSDPNNWDNGFGVNTNLNLVIPSGVTANGGRIYVDNGDELWFSTGPSSTAKQGSLTINGGVLQHNDGATNQKTSRIGDNGTGVVTQTSGTFYMNSGELRIGSNNTSMANGLYDISGGTLSTAGGLFPGGNVVLGSRANKVPSGPATGELRVSGSAVIDLGDADTGGAALLFGFGGGTPASSILSVNGSGATIDIDSIQMVNGSYPTPAALIKFSFDQTGVSTINLTGDFNLGTAVGPVPAGDYSAILAAGVLDLDYTGTPLANGTTFDLMVGDYIFQDSTFSLDASDTADWSMAVVGTGAIDGSSDILRVTYIVVPEPSSALALCVTGVFASGTRRRRV